MTAGDVPRPQEHDSSPRRRVEEPCAMCGGPLHERYRLYDREGEGAGEGYCSKDCARADAWGPRFRSFTIRRLARR